MGRPGAASGPYKEGPGMLVDDPGDAWGDSLISFSFSWCYYMPF